jgi:predicted transcriptional regulator
VLLSGEVVGLVTLPMLKAVARPDWEYVHVSEIADRDLDALTVDRSAQVESVIPRLAADRPGALLVIGDGRVVGIVTRSDVISLLERAGSIG